MNWKKLISDVVNGDEYEYDLNACAALCDAVVMRDEWQHADDKTIDTVIRHAVWKAAARMMYDEAFERSENNA